MVDLILEIVQWGIAGYGGVFFTRKYYSVGREAPAAVAARKQAKAQKALTR